MLDSDLADLYGVTAGRLDEAVRRNRKPRRRDAELPNDATPVATTLSRRSIPRFPDSRYHALNGDGGFADGKYSALS